MLKTRRFSQSEFARRQPARILDVDTWVASAEDAVLSKLEWAKMGSSERQLRDVRGIVEVCGNALDQAYLDVWAAELGVTDLLRRVSEGG